MPFSLLGSVSARCHKTEVAAQDVLVTRKLREQLLDEVPPGYY